MILSCALILGRYSFSFVGWTDENGNLVDRIKPGTTGNITLTANWTAKRNQTRPAKLQNPIIEEDLEDNALVFAYEIGTIENVPLAEIEYLGNKTGLSIEKTITKSTKISDTSAQNIAKTVTNTTTDSSNWTLSSNWTKSTSVSQNQSQEISSSIVDAYQKSVANTNSFSIGASFGGSKAKTTENGTTSKTGLNSKTSLATKCPGIEVSGELDIDKEDTTTKKDVESNTSTWNTNVGLSNSKAVSKNQSVSQSLSDKIATSYGYGNTYSEGGSDSSSRAFSSAQSDSSQYASTITYSAAEEETTVQKMSDASAPEGYYRIVRAGTLHVFAVVTYDIANSAYGVYTYSVMDDKTYDFVDYSAVTPNFDDNENGVLPFEVPYEVKEYVESVVGKSAGLQIDIDTGIIENFVGDAEYVVLPRYMSVDNGNGTKTVVKVTGISSQAFAGKPIKAIYLNDGVTSIPDGAFANCTELEKISAPAVTEIGESAFSGCTSLKEYNVTTAVTSLGANAFNDVQSLTVAAANASVAEKALLSAPKKLTLDMTAVSEEFNNQVISIPDAVESFEFIGGGKTYDGTKVVSNAQSTVLTDATFGNVKGTALKFSSSKVSLNRVNVSSSGWSMLLMADSTELGLYGTNTFATDGSDAIVGKDITITQSNPNAIGKLNSTGNFCVYQTLVGERYLSFTSGEVVQLDEATYNQYKAKWEAGAVTVTYNANGGTVTPASQDVIIGEAIGSMPVPIKEYHTFIGWFTDPENGNQITEATVFDSAEDVILYAHWMQNSVSEWVAPSNVPEGAEITSQKWTYTQRSYTENGSADMPGWTQYDSRQTSWTDWSGWSTSNPDNGSRDVEHQSVYDHTEYHYYRWRNSNFTGVFTYKNTTYNCTIFEETWFTYELPVSSKGDPVRYDGSDNGYTNRWIRANYSGNNSCDQTFTKDIYRDEWRYRDPVYTYYFYQDNNLESDAYPNGDNISNIVEWVQYREK